MVAYNFQKRFVAPIRANTKRQTIRAERAGRGRHARPGENLQLYFGLRTQYCCRIAEVPCLSVSPVKIDLQEPCVLVPSRGWDVELDLDDFAAGDGFADWDDMAAFWRAYHPGVLVFSGVLIRWEPIAVFDAPGPAGRGGSSTCSLRPPFNDG